MPKNLFTLTLDVYNLVTGNTSKNMSYLPALPVAKFTTEKVAEIDHSMAILLRNLKKRVQPNKNSAVRGFCRNALMSRLDEPTLKAKLNSFASDLFCYSDRWCAERVAAIELFWKLLSFEIIAHQTFGKQAVKISTDMKQE